MLLHYHPASHSMCSLRPCWLEEANQQVNEVILLKHSPEYVIPQLKTSQRISISHGEIQSRLWICKDLSHLPCHPFHLIFVLLPFAYSAVATLAKSAFFPNVQNILLHQALHLVCLLPGVLFPWISHGSLSSPFPQQSQSLLRHLLMREDFPGHLNWIVPPLEVFSFLPNLCFSW